MSVCLCFPCVCVWGYRKGYIWPTVSHQAAAATAPLQRLLHIFKPLNSFISSFPATVNSSLHTAVWRWWQPLGSQHRYFSLDGAICCWNDILFTICYSKGVWLCKLGWGNSGELYQLCACSLNSGNNECILSPKFAWIRFFLNCLSNSTYVL